MKPATGEAAVFEDPRFNDGAEVRDCVVLKVGKYPTFNANPDPFGGSTGGGYGLNTGVISSVIVGPHTTLVIYANGGCSESDTHVEIANPSSQPSGVDRLGDSPRTFDDRTASIWVH